MKIINAKELGYKELNDCIKETIKEDKHLKLTNINGQRYIGSGISNNIIIEIDGVPGNDLGTFCDGPKIVVNNNSQDGVGNTMNNGEIIIHGIAGDTMGYAMRGGEIYVKGNVGYRTGINMKQSSDKSPVIVIGGSSGDFLGEYMAGGTIIVLGIGLKSGEKIVGDYCATGIHGGTIYIRGSIEKNLFGKEALIKELDEDDYKKLSKYIKKYCQYFNFEFDKLFTKNFIKIVPAGNRPYANLYVY